MGYIYKITNDVNGKMYIGKTEYVNPEKRWKEHLKDYKRRKNEKRPLYAAMKKYGEEHFYFEIIEKSDNAEEREKYWIEKLRTYVGFKDCNGYNATLGGDGRSYLNLNEDDVVKYHIDEAYYMTSKTAEHFNVDKHVIKNILIKNNVPWLNVKQMVKLNTYQKLGGVFQIDYNTKLILNIFENTTEANIYMNKKERSSAITNACSGINSSHLAYGYLWYYGKDVQEAINNGEIIDIEDYYNKFDMSIFE